MPFHSLSQMRAAFAGGLGPEMKAKAPEWADKTPDLKDLPGHVDPDEAVRHLVRHKLRTGRNLPMKELPR